MEIEAIEKIMHFIEKKDRKYSVKWKLKNGETITDENLVIETSLDLEGSKVSQLPKGLEIKGYLSLKYTPNLEELPENLKVGYNEFTPSSCNLYLHTSNVKGLPKGLQVRDELWIFNSPLEKYTDDELKDMIKPNGHIGKIVR